MDSDGAVLVRDGTSRIVAHSLSSLPPREGGGLIVALMAPLWCDYRTAFKPIIAMLFVTAPICICILAVRSESS